MAPQENTWLVSNEEELKDNDKEDENLASSSHNQENELECKWTEMANVWGYAV